MCSRNFWFMVSANLLIALRKTLEEGRKLLEYPTMFPQTSLPSVLDQNSFTHSQGEVQRPKADL
jgi:hypothetical protein